MIKVDFIHIGIHKTASTYIQNCFFPKIHNLSIINNLNNDVDSWFYDNFIKINSHAFNKNDFIYKFQCLLPDFDKDAVIGISEESLSGDIYSGLESKELMHRIYDVFGSVKVLIVIRNQIDYILSSYSNYILHGGTRKLCDWVYGHDTQFGGIINKLQYSYLIEDYIKCFGRDNVKVLTYEDLFSSGEMNNFFRNFELELPVLENKRINSGRSLLFNHISRWLNFFGFYKIRGIYRLISFSSNNKHRERERVKRILGEDLEVFRKDNDIIKSKFNISLTKDYYL